MFIERGRSRTKQERSIEYMYPNRYHEEEAQQSDSGACAHLNQPWERRETGMMWRSRGESQDESFLRRPFGQLHRTNSPASVSLSKTRDLGSAHVLRPSDLICHMLIYEWGLTRMIPALVAGCRLMMLQFQIVLGRN